MKYRCLVLDHDDTVVNSTATIHYPAYVAYINQCKPGPLLTLEEYFSYNFDPGVIPMFRDICGLSEKEMEEEEAFWVEYVKDHIPLAYEGIKDILWKHKEQGGLICVVSHSFSHYILRDYEANGLPIPDKVFGWELDFGKLTGKILAVVDAVFALLVILGIVVDPTTAGIGDSKRALGYEEPWTDVK